ncbi:MAG: hypothetical protein A2015_16440 [Spirochaetes bacterium GWF1_31_7]|nr:MAG: hypothetical protein A2Y30_13805 [Spirochaetes bacterium GWE1_32_154]OHD50034.1 MAG: hypothetical protein A2Y29_11850 [Spirochaetes bacterium GWE2_31_10]OHD52348.1 MAG: hypothetical protein A2015_16440 [Spirochaetes bacterium GWF1_31_7]OHD83168.1 MAG: hypothetical protein A2355_10025 [Spirochaetes bacterium RIFOXYB1_FULL_32_8]HBD95987.1 hypothetical protein [Spirochaetia bacterium]
MKKTKQFLAILFIAIGFASCSMDTESNNTEMVNEAGSLLSPSLSETSITTGFLNLTVYEEVIVNGKYAYNSKPLTNANVYYNDLSPYGGPGTEYMTNENGQSLLSLPVGENTIMISKMTSSHSYFVSSVYTVYIEANKTTTLSIEVSPYEVKVEADYDVGYGNALYITGYGRLGWWTTAYKMTYVNGKWVWSGYLPKGIEFKVIKYKWIDGNNIATSSTGVQWEKGSNHTIEFLGPYSNNYIKPVF